MTNHIVFSFLSFAFAFTSTQMIIVYNCASL